ncbi:MAG TPA: GWxTD domain-containing protein, partial [Thermoanaerobaculia bacterium]|nr:GWxTD domain-containing protein [Thermoanaerobaculia bacterium]
MRLRLPTVLLLAVASAVAAVPASSQAAGAPPPAAAGAELSAKHRAWLDEVALLISPKEREAFLSLHRDYQRDAFIRRFWEMRDPFPKTARNELQERWEERVRLARERFGGLAGDRARMLLLNGDPPEVFKASCIELLVPLEIWSYPGTDRIRDPFSLVFIQGQGIGGYRLWYPSEGLHSLLAVGARMNPTADYGSAIAQVCTRGEDLASRIGEALDWAQIESRIQVVPRPSEEWLSTFTSYSTDLPADAKPLPARLDVSFPARYGSRTVVQGLVSVPREAAAVEKLADQSVYSFVIDGEVLREDELFEHFRYRFTLPSTQAKPESSPTLPIVFQRYLRPGVYNLVLKIEDTAGKSFFREQRQIEVPAVQGTAALSAAAAPAASTAAGAALAEANADVGSDENTIRILPPPPGLLTGKVRLEAMTTGEGIARVRFELNGKPVLTKGKPPYSVELSLGDQPRFHRLTARALGADGSELADDELLLNVGPHRFSVRLVEPQQGKAYRESLRAQAQIEVPEGETLGRVEFYLNDDLVATLFQPPFVQPILLPPGPQEMTYVRTVAYLADGNSTEDLAVVNMPGDFGEQIKVQFVELFTTA